MLPPNPLTPPTVTSPWRTRFMTIIKRQGQAEGVVEFGYIGRAVIGVVIIGIPALIAFSLRLENRLTRLEDAQAKIGESQVALLQAATKAEDQRHEFRELVTDIHGDVNENRRRIEALERWREQQMGRPR